MDRPRDGELRSAAEPRRRRAGRPPPPRHRRSASSPHGHADRRCGRPVGGGAAGRAGRLRHGVRRARGSPFTPARSGRDARRAPSRPADSPGEAAVLQWLAATAIPGAAGSTSGAPATARASPSPAVWRVPRPSEPCWRRSRRGRPAAGTAAAACSSSWPAEATSRARRRRACSTAPMPSPSAGPTGASRCCNSPPLTWSASASCACRCSCAASSAPMGGSDTIPAGADVVLIDEALVPAVTRLGDRPAPVLARRPGRQRRGRRGRPRSVEPGDLCGSHALCAGPCEGEAVGETASSCPGSAARASAAMAGRARCHSARTARPMRWTSWPARP